MDQHQPAPDTDPYSTDEHCWWHLSQPSPELLAALDEGWLARPGRVLDLGCGLGSEVTFLARQGFCGIGIDLSAVALQRAHARASAVSFVEADALHLPFPAGSFDILLDRGCFHYLASSSRPTYASEAQRVLRAGGRFLLRVCLYAEGVRNDIDETTLHQTFARWRFIRQGQAQIPSDSRWMTALVARLEKA